MICPHQQKRCGQIRRPLKKIEKMEVQNENENYNYGLALLRTLMCFEVVLCHLWTDYVPRFLMPFSLLRNLAVPVFMFLSFFLTEKTFFENNKIKKRKRIWRVIYPQIGWAIIYWLGYAIVQIKFDFGVRISDLLWQIFTGNSPKLNRSMWFQTVLIALTIIYILIFTFCNPQKGILITYLMLFAAFVLQYSGINFKLFNSLRYELRYPFGRFCEMIPYATLGFSCAYYDVLKRFKERRFASLTMCGLASILLFKYTIVTPAEGFGYSNNNCILLGFSVTAFAYLVPFEKLHQPAKNSIKSLTKYTLGIYCMHRLVAKVLTLLFSKSGVQVDSFILCIITYTASFLISFLMYRFPLKCFRQLVE